MTADDPFHHLHDEAYADRYAGRPATAATLVQGGGRAAESLDGAWRLTLDLFDEGLRQRWYALDEAEPADWDLPRDYEVAAGEPVAVPSCWNLLRPEWFHFEGAAWYARALDWTPGPPGERAILQIGAANYALIVFLNGVCLGAHRGGSTPCSIELTGALKPGANRLQIMVENRRRPDRAPMHHIDWFNYGGLYREVAILRLPPVFIRAAAVSLEPDGRGVRVAVTLSDPVDGEARVAIPELGIDAAVTVSAGRGVAVFPAAPRLWSPQDPHLHEVAIRFGADLWRDRIGLRTIATRGQEILLNGVALFLAGVCVHEDDVATGKATDEADIRRRFAHARELGANALRLAHYPHHEAVARIADEEGLLLWAEVPVYWAIDFANPDAFADAANQLDELIRRDVNRASVIFWGVGNENADTDARYAFMSELAERARATDPTRLVTAACLIDRERFAIADRLAAHLDVIGLNEYFGWYESDMEGFRRLVANSAPDRPVVISETGADAVVGHRGAGRALFSEDWQAQVWRGQIGVIEATPWIRGVFAWILYDFRTERRKTRFQRGYNRKGLIAEDKATRKLAFATLADAYRRLARPPAPDAG